jgi:hypothetical protein
MYRKFDGASGDAFVTLLTHDCVQLAGIQQLSVSHTQITILPYSVYCDTLASAVCAALCVLCVLCIGGQYPAPPVPGLLPFEKPPLPSSGCLAACR